MDYPTLNYDLVKENPLDFHRLLDIQDKLLREALESRTSQAFKNVINKALASGYEIAKDGAEQ